MNIADFKIHCEAIIKIEIDCSPKFKMDKYGWSDKVVWVNDKRIQFKKLFVESSKSVLNESENDLNDIIDTLIKNFVNKYI
jgi:hypothetical protein